MSALTGTIELRGLNYMQLNSEVVNVADASDPGLSFGTGENMEFDFFFLHGNKISLIK